MVAPRRAVRGLAAGLAVRRGLPGAAVLLLAGLAAALVVTALLADLLLLTVLLGWLRPRGSEAR